MVASIMVDIVIVRRRYIMVGVTTIIIIMADGGAADAVSGRDSSVVSLAALSEASLPRQRLLSSWRRRLW